MVSIPLGAKRYDGGAGSAVFAGAIPLKPGQLFEANLATVAMWDDGTEIECTASALWPQHPDGSVKVVQIATTLTLTSGVQKNLTLRLGEPRTVPGPTQPTINLAWMRNPRLIGCTDAAHMCASRVALLPLVPIPHPNLPAAWNDFLTTGWDFDNRPPVEPAGPAFPSWGRFRDKVMADDHLASGSPILNGLGLGGTAGYNFTSAMYHKYMTSGELDRLNEAHHLAQYGAAERIWNGGGPLTMWAYCYGSAHNRAPSTNNGQLNGIVFNGDGTAFNANPEGWPDYPGGSGGGYNGSAEWWGAETDLFMIYIMSGWEQAKGAFLARTLQDFGARGFPDTPGTVALDNVLGGNCGTSIIRDNQYKGNYGGRTQWRFWHGSDILYFLLSAPGALFRQNAYTRGSTIPSPRTSPRADWATWFKREHLDFFDCYSDRYVTGHWLKGSWWGTPGWYPAGGGIPQGLPYFQLKLLMYDILLYYMHAEQDPRVTANIVATANRLRQCAFGNASTGYKLGYSIFNSQTNNPTDGPQVENSGAAYWSVTVLLLIFTAAYRITGDAFYRDLADKHANRRMLALTDGSPAGYGTAKEAGELYYDAFHAAAYRAGVPVGGWDVEPERPPIPGGLRVLNRVFQEA